MELLDKYQFSVEYLLLALGFNECFAVVPKASGHPDALRFDDVFAVRPDLRDLGHNVLPWFR